MEVKERTKQQLMEKIERLQRRVTELERLELDRKKMEEELKKTRNELEIQTWGLEKTNKSIKILYKELEKKNKELQELSQLKSDFVSTVSHELRTPLSIIKAGIDLVIDRIPGSINEKQEKVLATAKDNTERLGRIIDSLLDISRIEAGKVELKRQILGISDLIRQVLSSFELRVKGKGLELRVNLPKETMEVYADQDKITQVFTNLAGNALKFTENGYIEISARERGGEIECSVTDTGAGIPQDAIDKIFDKFHQVGRKDGPGAKGTGLGLAISKELVRMHKGNIWAESEIGKGSKFIFTIPKNGTEIIFKEHLSDRLSQAREQGVPLSLLVIALADFEQMKQKYETEAIAKLLDEITPIATKNISGSCDTIKRYSKGQLVIVLLRAGRRDASTAGEKLEKVINEHNFTLEGKPMKVEVSSDIATYHEDFETEDEFIEKAETSLKMCHMR